MASVVVLLAACIVASNGIGASDLKSLYDAHRWIELHDAVQSQDGSALYRGVAAAVFNDRPEAERILRSVIASSPQSEDAYLAYEWLTHVYFATGQYRKMVSAMDARWAAFPNKSEKVGEQKVIEPFRGLPDQESGEAHPTPLRHDPGEIFIPISINGFPADYFFDTGAWLNCMSESEAKRLSLTVAGGGGDLATSTGARVGFRTAVVSDLVVGSIRYRNVSFAVFPDDQEPWSTLRPGRRGLIGIPIIQAFRTLRWERDGDVEIGGEPAAPNPRNANLFFDNDHLVLAAQLNRHTVYATLDTGAITTDLYAKFAATFPGLMTSSTRKRTEVRGVGNAVTLDAATLPRVEFELGHARVVLKPAQVLLKQIGADWCIGNFGMDLLRQARAFKIDFGAMRLDLERSR